MNPKVNIQGTSSIVISNMPVEVTVSGILSAAKGKGLTRSSIRSALVRMEEAGLVERRGTRPLKSGEMGRPETIWSTTDAGVYVRLAIVCLRISGNG